MKTHNLDAIYLSKKSMVNAVALLNKYRMNERVYFRNKFERQLEEYLKVKHVYACNSGTNGLHVALLAMGIKTGDEIITNALDCIAVISAILKCGGNPVLTKIKKNGAMDIDDVKQKVTSRTKGIIAVHLNGFMEDMAALMDFKKKYGLFIIEDAAQAMGSELRTADGWKKAGAIGDIGIFSFGLLRLITTIEGGAVVTNDTNLAERMKSFLGFGSYEDGRQLFGLNSRMDHLRAAIGSGNLESINDLLALRKARWLKYYESLKCYEWLHVLTPAENQRINYVSFAVFIEDQSIREKIVRRLLSNGYEVANNVKRNADDNACVSHYAGYGMKQHVQNFTECNISLPTHHALEESDIQNIIDSFAAIDASV